MSLEEALVRDDAAEPAVDRQRDQVSTYVWWPGRTDYESFELERLSDIAEALSERTEPAGLFWVDLFDPEDGDDSLLMKIGDELGFSQETIRLAADDGTRPKAARHATHTFITTYATDLDTSGERGPMESRVVTSRISAFLLERGLVTVRHDRRFDRDQLVERWSADRHLHDFGSGGLLYELFDLLVDDHFDTISSLEDEIEALEGRLFVVIDPNGESEGESDGTDANQRLQFDVFRLRKELVALRRVVLPMREVVRTVDHDPLGGAKNGELDALYDELHEQILRLTEWTDSLHDMITAVYETNLSVQDARLNQVMKRLTGWAAIIAVPTLITGWFGQNVYYPGANASSGLIASTLIIIVLALPLWWAFRKHHWI